MAKHIELYLSNAQADLIVKALDSMGYLMRQMNRPEEAEDYCELVRLLEAQIEAPENK